MGGVESESELPQPGDLQKAKSAKLTKESNVQRKVPVTSAHYRSQLTRIVNIVNKAKSKYENAMQNTVSSTSKERNLLEITKHLQNIDKQESQWEEMIQGTSGEQQVQLIEEREKYKDEKGLDAIVEDLTTFKSQLEEDLDTAKTANDS